MVTERIVVDSQQITLEANDASVWVRRHGEWACAMHTESLVERAIQEGLESPVRLPQSSGHRPCRSGSVPVFPSVVP